MAGGNERGGGSKSIDPLLRLDGDAETERDEITNVLRAIIESSPDPILMVDEEWRATLWNPAAEEVFGWSEEEVLGAYAPIVPEEKEAEFEEFVEEMDAGRPKQFVETVRRGKDGSRIDVNISAAKVETDGEVIGYLGILKDVSQRKERERELECQRNALERVTQIVEAVRPLNHALAAASTREEIERVICEQLGSAEAYTGAWYGDFNPTTEQISPKTSAGVEDGLLDAFRAGRDVSIASRQSIGRAALDREVVAFQDVLSDPTFEPCKDDALERGYRSIAGIPVVFDETVYGVIGLYSDRPEAFDDYEQGLLREIGELIGHAIRAAENERLLHSDSVVELEFRTTGPESVFVRATEDLDCRLELESITPASGNSHLCYTTVEGAEPEAVVEYLADSTVIDGPRVVESTGRSGRIEYRVNESPVVTLLDYGATVQRAVVESGVEMVVGEVSPDADASQIVAGLQEAFSDTTFVAKRSVDRPERTIPVPEDALEEVLTDRQREVFEVAYRAGFFESPRHSSGDEIADALGISSPTFYLHVRKATQKLLERLDSEGMFG